MGETVLIPALTRPTTWEDYVSLRPRTGRSQPSETRWFVSSCLRRSAVGGGARHGDMYLFFVFAGFSTGGFILVSDFCRRALIYFSAEWTGSLEMRNADRDLASRAFVLLAAHALSLSPHAARRATDADPASGPWLNDTALPAPSLRTTISLARSQESIPRQSLSAPSGECNPSIANAR